MTKLKDILIDNNAELVEFGKDHFVSEEGHINTTLHYVVSGKLEALTKSNNKYLRIFEISPDSLIGLFSFFEEDHLSFFSVRSTTDIKLIRITKEMHDLLQKNEKDYGFLLLQEALKEFRHRTRLYRQLQEKIFESTEKLVIHEKMATVGRLSASLAHELNNNISVISKGLEYFNDVLPSFFTEKLSSLENNIFIHALNNGYQLTSRKIRQETSLLSKNNKYAKTSNKLLSLAVETKNNNDSINLDYLLELSLEDLQKLNTLFILGCKFKNISQASTQITHVVNGFKTLSRPPGELKPFPVHETIEQAKQLLQHRMQNIIVYTNYKFTDPISCRQADLIQLWNNLLVNSIDAMNGIGEIFIDVSRKDNDVIISIQDTGPGIPPDKMEAIFQPHISSKLNISHYGLGLGLTICSQVISLHRGKITPRNVENGACMEISIPIKGDEK